MGADLRRPPESDLIAIGGTSEVYRMGSDLVAKILRVGVPSAWAELEASFTESVRRLGIPAPEVREVATVEGRPAILFRLVDGPSMWTRMRDDRASIPDLVGQLVDIQRDIHTSGVPEHLPSLVTRMRRKLEASKELSAAEHHEADDLLRSLPSGCALLHGDLHPGNILFDDEGPVVVDWFDVTVGHPVADLARTALLVRSVGATDLRHLPGATPSVVSEIEHCYLEQISQTASNEFESWMRLTAASRLAERTDNDSGGLLQLWRAR